MSMLSLLYVLLLALHLMAMNVASAGPLVCLWVEWRNRRRRTGASESTPPNLGSTNDIAAAAPAASAVVAERLAAWSLWLLIGGIAIGFALLAWAWGESGGGLRAALARFPAQAYWYASGELVFSAVCLAAYWMLVRRRRARFGWHGVFAILSATNLLYHFPPLMAIIGSLAAAPASVTQETITRPVVRELMLRPDILALTVHFHLASLAVSGVALMLIARRVGGSDSIGLPDDLSELVVSGGRVALGATTGQLVVGTWLLLVQNPSARRAVMGSDLPATGMLLAALGITFVLLHLLAAIALGDVAPRAVRNCAAAMAIVIVLMLGTMVRMRAVSAGPPGRSVETAGVRLELALRRGQKESRKGPVQPLSAR